MAERRESDSEGSSGEFWGCDCGWGSDSGARKDEKVWESRVSFGSEMGFKGSSDVDFSVFLESGLLE